MVIKAIARSTNRYISATNAFALLTTLSNVACNIPTEDFVFPLHTPMDKELIQKFKKDEIRKGKLYIDNSE